MTFARMNISAYNLRSPRLIFVTWITIGLVYGVQRYLLGFLDGYNCDFFAMVTGQLYHFVIYGIISVTVLNLNRRVEQNLINLNRASLLKYAAILCSLIMLQLAIAYTVYYMTCSESFSSAASIYYSHHPFGWMFTHVIIYAAILIIFFPSLWKMVQVRSGVNGKRVPESKSGVGDRQKEFEYMAHVIKNERLFNRPDLTLSAVAERTGFKERVISSLINSVANKGFNEFINELKVEEAKRELIETDKSIKEIQYATGFKSKTTFFDNFKKLTNKTPREFREMYKRKFIG